MLINAGHTLKIFTDKTKHTESVQMGCVIQFKRGRAVNAITQ